MPDRTLVIVNPRSRGGATGRRWPRLEPRLRRILGPFEWVPTGGPLDARRIAAEAARAGIERIIVAGGDGTLSEVVTGLLSTSQAGEVELGMLPLGTGGDFARSLGLPRDPEAAAARLLATKPRPVDAGRVRYVRPDGRPASSCFVNVASFGISGMVVHLTARAPRLFGGSAAFLIGTLRALLHHRCEPVRVRLDHRVVFEGPLVLATAANGRWFGGGMQIAPGARIDDGLLDLVVVPEMSKAELAWRLPRLYRGTHLSVAGVRQERGRVLEVESLAGEVPIEVDGEPLGRLPLHVELVPGALRLLGSAP